MLKAPNLPGWIDIPLRDRLMEHFELPVVIGNDANVAALGEWQFGAGKGTRHLIYLTISTGIGGGVIVDGRLVTGADGLAGELGHMTVDPQGPRCGCGQNGHLEAIAAGPAIARNTIAMLESGRNSTLREKYQKTGKITAKDVGLAARKGDEVARTAVEEAGEVLGRFLASLAHAFNPEIFVLGGGVSQIGPLLFETIRSAFSKSVIHPAYSKTLRIVPAALGDDAGLVGAMVLATQT
ncbi:MAG: ROK family protein [Anaerolineales bacterium]|nr:ROK family protein [Anaerolineales bacterium]